MSVAHQHPNTGPIPVRRRMHATPSAKEVALDTTGEPETLRRGLPGLRMPRRTTDRLRAQTTSLGTGFLGIAATVLAVVLALFEVGRFATEWRSYSQAGLATASWLLLAGLLVALAAAARSAGDRLSNLVGSAITAALLGVIALDAAAVWSQGDLGRDLTSAPATGTVILAMVGVRSARSIAIAAGGLGAVLIALVCVQWTRYPMPAGGIEAAFGMVATAIAPPLVAAGILGMFRRVVDRELERVLIQSTVSAPRFSVGMLASEELARLDLAAEQLLDDVATGRNRLPLNPASAQAAASLATELRLHLIEGRRQTWLYHAVSESELLGRAVTLSDPDSLAGLMASRQRDGLLQAVWLLLGDSPERSRRSALRMSLQITVGPSNEGAKGGTHVPIAISTTGVPRNRVDPGTWDAIRKVGRHSDTQRNGSLFIEIDCVVELPER
jgi:hypothetical protein